MMTIEEALQLPAVLTVGQAAELLNLGRTATYEAVRAESIPSVRLGRHIRIPTASLLLMIGLSAQGQPMPVVEEETTGPVLDLVHVR